MSEAFNIRNEALDRAINTYLASPFFPFAAVKMRNEAEFDFCSPDDDDAMAADVDPVYVGQERARGVDNFVVWELGEPNRWWRWDATRDPILGLSEIEIARHGGKPVRLVATPHEWGEIIVGCVCVLDWEADIRGIFSDLEVMSDDPALERTYARAWRRRKWGPRISRAR